MHYICGILETCLCLLLRPQDEPLVPDDDVDRKIKRQQPDEDNSAEIEAASFKKFHMEVNALSRVSGWAGFITAGDTVHLISGCMYSTFLCPHLCIHMHHMV